MISRGSLALSLFPLTRDQREACSVPADSEWVPLSSLRSLGLRGALKLLRRRRFGRVTFVLTPSDPQELSGLADLALSLTRSRRKELQRLGPPAESRPAVPFFRAAGGFLWAALAGGWAALLNAAAALRLLRGRAPRRRGSSGVEVAYFRASFGLPNVGGSVGHTAGVIRALQDAGCRVSFFGPARPVGLAAGAEYRPIPLPATVAYPHEFNFHRYSRRFRRAAMRLLAKRPPAFVYQRYVVNDLSGVEVARALGIPLVLEYNGSEVWAQRNWGRALLLEGISASIERACLKRADLVVTVSEPLRDEVVARGIDPERVLFYPNGVDEREFDPSRFGNEEIARTRAALGVPAGDCVLTFVGTFGRWHGAEVFARAIRRLPRDVDGRRLHFLFVGDGVTSAEVKEILAEEIAGGRATLAGPRPQDETPATLAASDILVSPHVPNSDGSRFFGSPTKLFEYMAMARPIVASDLDQVGEILRGWTPVGRIVETAAPLAILCRPGDAGSLADGLLRAVRLSREEREEMGRRSRAQVLSAFTWAHHVRAILGSLVRNV